VTLRVEHVQVEETATRLPLGGHWVDVPEPFATLLRDHLNRRANMNTAANAGSSWLFPGQMPGRHLHPQTVVDVLRDAGIPPLAARTGTWLRLVRGDTASGRAYMSELGRARDGRQGLNYAIYHDRYQRTGDGWKFTERVYEVRYEDTTPLAGSPPRPAGAPADPPAENTAAAEGPR
jgi:hypothetical protein